MAAAAAIVFTLCSLNYEVPRLLDVVTYPVLILVDYGANDDPGLAFAAALPCFASAALVLLATLRWAARRSFALAGRGDAGAGLRAPRPGALAWTIAAAWVLAAVVWPAALLLDLAGPAATYAKAWRADGDKVLATALHALGVGLLAALVAGLLLLPPRGSVRPRSWLWLPFALPAALLGFACVRLGQLGPLFPLYNGGWMLLFAHVVRFFPVAYFALAAHLRSVPRELWDAAELVPAASRRWWGTRLPLAAPGLAAGAVAAALLASGELQATLLLAAPGSHPVIVEIFNLLHYHPERDALAALCVLHAGGVIAAVGVLLVVGRLLGGRPAGRQG
jgi:iron(III) transport system permease protein